MCTILGVLKLVDEQQCTTDLVTILVHWQQRLHQLHFHRGVNVANNQRLSVVQNVFTNRLLQNLNFMAVNNAHVRARL